MNTIVKLSTFTILILLTTSVFLLPNILVKAQDENYPHGGQAGPTQYDKVPPTGVTPELSVDVTPYLSFRPNPIGVGQSLLVNVWTTPPPAANRYLSYYTVTITKPDGSTDVFGPFNSYVADGTSWFEYVPKVAGNYSLRFDYGGTYFPAGTYIGGVLNGSGVAIGFNAAPSTYPSTWFKPTSTQEQSLTVQTDQVASWPPSPLPTGYWTRPISPENREWYVIGGNYPYSYFNDAQDWLGPFVIAPNTAHVAWKQPQIIAGIMGGETGTYALNTREFQDPGAIFAGRIYMTYPKQGVGNVAGCYDLRTGQTIYEIPISQGGVTPLAISYAEGTPAVPGAEPSLTAELIGGSRTGLYTKVTMDSRLIKIDPWTGLVTTNVTGMVGQFYNNQYVLSMQDLGSSIPSNQRYRLINWTTVGSSTNFTSRIISNITFPVSTLPGLLDYDRGIGVQVNRFGAGAVYGGNLYAINLQTGALLWNMTIDPETPFGGSQCIDNGKVAVAIEDRYWEAWDIYTGKVAWKSPLIDYPWGDFWSYDASSWNGMVYSGAYTGIYAFNWTNGDIVWKFQAPSVPFETPYSGLYSFHAATIVADGKLYTYGSEHTPSEPITRGWKFYCLNATNGDKIWEFAGSGVDSRRFRGAAADGYLTVSNTYDGNMYVFGKGKSAMTLQTPLTAVIKNTALVIQGTLLDLSPGQPGTPCVSAASMTTQMEYIHMQKPIDGIWHNETITGVPVMLTAIDSNNNPTDLGTVTTDGYYGSFSKTWTPPNVGDYKIIASFAGDNSYGSSSASTTVSITEVANSTPTATQNQNDYSMMIIESTIAIIIVIVVAVTIATLLILRRK
jgi:outer membrane protein assembly factor BamB